MFFDILFSCLLSSIKQGPGWTSFNDLIAFILFHSIFKYKDDKLEYLCLENYANVEGILKIMNVDISRKSPTYLNEFN